MSWPGELSNDTGDIDDFMIDIYNLNVIWAHLLCSWYWEGEIDWNLLLILLLLYGLHLSLRIRGSVNVKLGIQSQWSIVIVADPKLINENNA